METPQQSDQVVYVRRTREDIAPIAIPGDDVQPDDVMAPPQVVEQPQYDDHVAPTS
ncbi:hypothetical protein OROHE_000425 [Orobanche hederae]